MFGGIKVSHPSCQIRHAVTCCFFRKSGVENDVCDSNLILVSLDRLWVYGLNTSTKSQSNSLRADRPKTSSATEAHVFLECLAEYCFHGKILDLAWISLPHNAINRDSLVLAFADAKISIVEYDPLLHDLRTVSMHYYENDYEGAQESRQQWIEHVSNFALDVVEA